MPLAALLGGCSSLGYYSQSLHGQLGVMAASRPVEDVVADSRTPETVRLRLQQLPDLRRFAIQELALPETASYGQYADLGREAMVWSVVAAPVDSLQAREWCYPVLGCARYRGYFSEHAAQAYASELSAEGWDAAVEPVPAYSTLGWFNDPLPSTVIHWPLPAIAGLLFHELAHEALYVPGDSAFNEAYATTVEKEGVRRWLSHQGSAQQRAEYEQQERRRHDFLDLLAQTRQRLAGIYAADIGYDERLLKKRSVFEELHDDYARLKAAWGGDSGYDKWFDRPLNNAHLASVSTYYELQPVFGRILQQSQGDMAVFHTLCREIAAMPPIRRNAYMKDLLTQEMPQFKVRLAR